MDTNPGQKREKGDPPGADELLALVNRTYQEHDRFRLAVESTNDGIWDWDIASGDFWFSARCKTMLGYGAADLEGCSIDEWYKLLLPADMQKARDFIADNCKGHLRPAQGLRFNYASGGVLHIMCRVTSLRDETGRVVRLVGVHTDITDLVAMQEAFKLERDRVEAANRAKSDFLANMSHEIRTPMNAIMGMIDLLLETNLDPQQSLWAGIVKNSSASLLDIINDILDISKIEAGKLDLEATAFNLSDVIEQATDTMVFKAREKNLELLTRTSVDAPRNLRGDPVRLRQILINLLSNAIKFTNEGSIVLSVTAQRLPRDKVHLFFEVSDTGIGIPADKLNYIFEKFTQAQESTTRKFGGTGLGLAICRKLVNLMGGDIGVRSKLGQGSVFIFDITLPIDTEAPSSRPRPALDLTELAVLVVDDSSRMRAIFRDYFDAWNIRATLVTDTSEALEALAKASAAGKPFHIALVDYQLQKTGGRELAALIRGAGFADLQMMAIRSGDHGNIAQMQAEGFEGVLLQPFSPSQLMNKLAMMWLNRVKGVKGKFITRHSVYADSGRALVSGVDCSHLNVLVVEDLKANQIYLQALLKKSGCGIDVASNGLEAVARAQEKNYDIIFMDCQMPEMDGFEATVVIRALALAAQPYIVALTADAMQGDRERCLAAGMDDYLNKPVKASKITAIMEKVALSKN